MTSTEHRLTGIHHVQLAKPDGEDEAAIHFYGRVLGLEPVPKPDELSPRGGVWFRSGTLEVHLGVEDGLQPAVKAHPAFLVVGNERSARRVLGSALDDYLCFLDPDGAFVKSAGLTKLPAFAYVRLDGTMGGAAEGWDPNAWDDVVELLAKEMAWTRPLIPSPGDPAPFPGWNA